MVTLLFENAQLAMYKYTMNSPGTDKEAIVSNKPPPPQETQTQH